MPPQAAVWFSAAGSARTSSSGPACFDNTPCSFVSIPAAGAPGRTQTGILPCAQRCTPRRQKRSGNASTVSGIFAASPGSLKPIAGARNTEGPSLRPRRFDTNPSRTENAPGSGLQKPEALAQYALARINSPVLRQRRFGVDVGQGSLLLRLFLLGKKISSTPSLDHFS